MINKEEHSKVIERIKDLFPAPDIKVGIYDSYEYYFTAKGKFDGRKKGFKVSVKINYSPNLEKLAELLHNFYSNLKVIIKEYNEQIAFFGLTSTGFNATDRHIVYNFYFLDYETLAKRKLSKY